MNNKVSKLKNLVINLAQDPKFIHHKWFVKWHLEIVEKIATELCDFYPSADKEIVLGLVWIHDLAKIIDINKEHDEDLMKESRELLIECGFEENFSNRLVDFLLLFEKKMEINLEEAPIEIQIVSSADAAAHVVGPFYPLYWYDNPNLPIEELIEENKRKLQKDWDKKITLPEVKEHFKKFYDFTHVLVGELPDKYFSD